MTDKRSEEWSELFQRNRDGDQQAVHQFIDRFGPHILRVVRRNLDKRIRTKFDSLDFVQDVWASFFIHQAPDCKFDSPEALINYLVTMARNKVIDEYRRRYLTQSHDIERERSLDGSAAFVTAKVSADQPTPSQIVSTNEEWELLLKGQPVHYRKILLMIQAGHSHEDIARTLGISAKTVQRLLVKLAQRQVS